MKIYVLGTLIFIVAHFWQGSHAANDVLNLPPFLAFLAQYAKESSNSLSHGNNNFQASAVVTITPIARPLTGGMLCGMNKYSDTDASLPQMPPYTGNARPNEAPWLARVIDATTYRWFCDAVVLSQRALLTAASCLEPNRKYQVVLGDHVFGQMDQGETTVNVEKIVIHPSFNKANKKNDFAILFTALNIPTEKTTIRPICLPTAGDTSDYVNSYLWTVGWAHSSPVRTTHLLKEGSTTLAKPVSECRKAYQQHQHHGAQVSVDEAVCVGTGRGDVCSADLGSPLIEYRNGRHFLVGVGSTVGNGCINKFHYPAVFSRVTSAVAWILNQINEPPTNAPPPPPPHVPSPLRPSTIFRPPVTAPATRPTPPPPPSSSNQVIDVSAPQCGITKYMEAANKVTQRIVGGSDAKINQIPWQVRLIIRGYLCGGTIINKRVILTAAHCIGTKDVSYYRAVAGDHSSTAADAGEQIIEIAKVIVHEGYSEVENRNDFAILITAKDIPFTTWAIRPACLPSKKSETYAGQSATVSGWGRLSTDNKITPDTLKLTTVTVHPNSKCEEAYRSRNWLDSGVKITSEMICASAKNTDTCQGDSGGPMTVLENGRHTLIGVTSFGKSCASDSYPGVYARVTTVLDWLERTMAKNMLRIK